MNNLAPKKQQFSVTHTIPQLRFSHYQTARVQAHLLSKSCLKNIYLYFLKILTGLIVGLLGICQVLTPLEMCIDG